MRIWIRCFCVLSMLIVLTGNAWCEDKALRREINSWIRGAENLIDRKTNYDWLCNKYKSISKNKVRAEVSFTVWKNGRMEKAWISSSSGVPQFDKAALQTIQSVQYFDILPYGYKEKSITMRYTMSCKSRYR